jgi:hypothetical protein
MKDWKDILWEDIKNLPYPKWIEKIDAKKSLAMRCKYCRDKFEPLHFNQKSCLKSECIQKKRELI